MTVVPLKTLMCPCCGFVIDVAAGLDTEGPPNPGDACMCVGCGGILCFTEGNGLRAMTPEEEERIPLEQRLLLILMRRAQQDFAETMQPDNEGGHA